MRARIGKVGVFKEVLDLGADPECGRVSGPPVDVRRSCGVIRARVGSDVGNDEITVRGHGVEETLDDPVRVGVMADEMQDGHP